METTTTQRHSSPSLYDQLGGEPAVDAAVMIFYAKVVADPLLAPFFEGVDMQRQADKQKRFLTFALGGPSRYHGRGMRHAHAALVERGLGNRHFDAVLGHLASTLKELGVPDGIIASAAAIVESTRTDVLGA